MSRSTLVFWAMVGVLVSASVFFAVGAERRRAAPRVDDAAEAH